MTPPLTLRDIAQAEIEEAFGHYEEQRPGLGHRFLAAVATALAEVEEFPWRYPKVRGEIRRALVAGFPYSILYIAEPEQTIVIACFHARRDPRHWHNRR
jgi:plasmid stabilization system protein ParE